jgi:hypothetical protein
MYTCPHTAKMLLAQTCYTYNLRVFAKPLPPKSHTLYEGHGYWGKMRAHDPERKVSNLLGSPLPVTGLCESYGAMGSASLM